MVQTDFGGPEAVFPQVVPEPMRGPREFVAEGAYRGRSRLDPPRLRGPGPAPGIRHPRGTGTDSAGTVAATGPAVSPVVPGAGPYRSHPGASGRAQGLPVVRSRE
ncbi:hypothetical protein ACIBCM_27145 [Streptomyces sp. NPDC051018]|uniref:hypothetical protein n=1 Tax=Streptomyces sp. NPDC051018 TaxID=3365639 RepID=UPI0037AF6BBC